MGVSVQFDTMGMIKTIIDVVLLPVLFGLLMNQYLPAVASRLKVVLPFLGLAGATVCSGAPVAAHAAAMKSSMGLVRARAPRRACTHSVCTSTANAAIGSLGSR